jgi:hypothetical protein
LPAQLVLNHLEQRQLVLEQLVAGRIELVEKIDDKTDGEDPACLHHRGTLVCGRRIIGQYLGQLFCDRVIRVRFETIRHHGHGTRRMQRDERLLTGDLAGFDQCLEPVAEVVRARILSILLLGPEDLEEIEHRPVARAVIQLPFLVREKHLRRAHQMCLRIAARALIEQIVAIRHGHCPSGSSAPR